MIACLFLPRLADKFGRFSVYIVTITLQLPLYFLSNMAKTLFLQYIVSFLLGIAMIGRFTSGFVLLTESVAKKHKVTIGAALATGDVATSIYITFYLRYISKNIHTLIWIGLVMNVIVVIASYWNVESPSWLASVGQTEMAKRNILWIAKFNGVKIKRINDLVPDSENIKNTYISTRSFRSTPRKVTPIKRNYIERSSQLKL